MKRWMILAAALALGGCNNKPTGFGVDVEARTNMLSSSVRSSIVTARLLVSGDETFSKDIGNVAKAAQSGAFKFRYVPGVRSGTLTIRVDGVDGSGATVAGGTAPPINLADGKAVDAVLTLAVNGNGVACMAATDCISGNCVDGVCCDTACDGVCESCNQPGLVGQCSPAMQGTDPDNDCAAKLPPTTGEDGGVNDDGGTGGSVDGGVTGVMADPQKCAGTCNGMRACSFPDTTTSCGTPFCSAGATIGSLFCDGNGSCTESDSSCTDYVCAAGTCKDSCNSDADCQSQDFCNLNINKCVPKRDIGTACTGTDQCQSGFCVNAVCCDSVCNDQGQSCNNTGALGKCQCTGHPCPAGVSCVLFYRDSDNDTFGDAGGTIANGNAVAACVGDTPTAPFVANNKDCDDGDSQANPNQTGWFTSPSKSKGTFDYNCDGTVEKLVPEIAGGTCNFCQAQLPICGAQSTCTVANSQSTYSCSFFKGCHLGATLAFVGFPTGGVQCGNSQAAQQCGTCTQAGLTAQVSFPTTQQQCH